MIVQLHTINWQKISEISILSLLAFSILWKGGKSLESTWLLLGIGAICLLAHYVWYHDHTSPLVHHSRHLWLLCTLFVLWTLLSYLFSSSQNYGLDEVLRSEGLVMVLLWYTQKRNVEQFTEQFFTWITTLSVISCVIGIVVYIAQPVNRFVGTFFDYRFHTDYWPNACAELLLLAWPIALFTASMTREDNEVVTLFGYSHPLLTRVVQHPLSRFVPCAILLGSLLLTFSRGAIIAFFGQVALLSVFLGSQNGGKNRLKAPLSHIAIALLMSFVLFVSINEAREYFHPVQSVTEKITFSADEGPSSVSERASFWRHAILLAPQRPLFGWGPYSFRFVHPRYQQSVLATSDHPHNVFLKLAVERGIIAMILFFLILYTTLRPALQLSLHGKRFTASDHTRLGYPLLVISIAGVIAHNLIDYNMQFVAIALPFWLLLGVVARHAGMVQWNWAPLSRLYRWLCPVRAWISSLVAVGFLLLAVREGYYLTISSVGRRAEATGLADEALHWYSQAHPEWFTRDLRLSEAHLLWKKGEIEKAQSSVQRYLQRNTQDARAWKLHGELLMEQQSYEGAIIVFEKAFRYGGWNDLGISRGLLEALFAQTFTQPTSDTAAESQTLPLHPRIERIAPEIESRLLAFTEAIERNAHFVALSPNPEEAVKVIITLSVLYPENVERYNVLRRRIEAAAQNERSRIRARPQGQLW